MKQTFEIPNGCTRVTIEQHEDKVLTIFETRIEESFMDKVVSVSANCLDFEFKEDEPEVRFKEGDILNCEGRIFIFSGKYGNHTQVGISGKCLYLLPYIGFHETDKATFATDSEKQQLFDALAKVGKKWNAEKKCIEELKPKQWRAELGKVYWLLNTQFKTDCDTEQFSRTDNGRYNAGNYFQTKQQAKDFAEKIKQLPR